MAKALIIGAQNIDIFAQAKGKYSLHDSNPSQIHLAFGGVGRNIAENLSRLGNEVHFLSVFGDDHFSDSAARSLEKLNINISHSRFSKKHSNGIYLGIMDRANDLFLGLNDMEILQELNPEFLKKQSEFINQFDTLIIDNNLIPESLHYLLNHFHEKNIIMDAVSAKKAVKLIPYLDKISLLKLNRLELDALSKAHDVLDQLKDLHEKGALKLLITNQEKDILLSSPEKLITKKTLTIDSIVNATGAGDGFLSGFIHGFLHHFGDDRKLNLANRVAHLSLMSNNSTNELLNLEEVEKYE
jgi:pseudouridine kinase